MLLALGAAFAFCFPLTLKGYTITMLKRPLLGALRRAGGNPALEGMLPTLYPAGGFAVAMKVAAECAVVVALPFLIYFAGVFVLPALTRRERTYFAPALIAGAVLFYAGMAFCYLTTLPWALRFFWEFNRLMGIDNLWTINEYITFTSRLLIAFGIVFELPMVILFLVRVGILDHRILSEKRRYAIVLVFVVAAVMTPGPDVVSQVIMALPLLLLYELCVWAAKLMERLDAGRETG
jgi:sec-independent protein translocase protein TatC